MVPGNDEACGAGHSAAAGDGRGPREWGRSRALGGFRASSLQPRPGPASISPMNHWRFLAAAHVIASAVVVVAADKPAPSAPPVITPGTTFSHGAAAPSDAVVLFDGKDLTAWKAGNGGAPTWKVSDGAMQVSGGDLMTREEFGDIQLHVEWEIGRAHV